MQAHRCRCAQTDFETDKVLTVRFAEKDHVFVCAHLCVCVCMYLSRDVGDCACVEGWQLTGL